MKIKYFPQTDSLYIEFKAGAVAETRDLDENTILDLDRQGNICGLTLSMPSPGRRPPDSPSSRSPPESDRECSGAGTNHAGLGRFERRVSVPPQEIT